MPAVYDPATTRARRHSRAVWLVVLVALAVAAVVVGRRLAGPAVAVVTVARREIVQQVVASGRVLAPARVALGTLTTGRVIAVLVDEGSQVFAGLPLVLIDDSSARAELARAEAAVDQAAARLDRLRRVSSRVAGAEESTARARLKIAETELRRVERLAGQQAVPEQELEQARASYEVARSQALGAEALAAGSAAGGAEVREALAALEQARATAGRAARDVEDRRILAPASGTILARDVEPGDVVQPGRTLLVLARAGDTEVEIEPEERNLSVLRVGQPARVSADAFPDQVFPARLSTIAPAVDPLRGTIAVKLRVPHPPGYLRPDMTVSVNVEVARRAAALVVPPAAVHDLAGAEPWVLVVRDARARKQPVGIGLAGDGAVELASGVSEGDVVILSREAAEPGQRVRPIGAGR